MRETLELNLEAVRQRTTAAADGGLCHVRDVLPEVLLRHGLSLLPPSEAETFLTFVDSSSGAAAEAVTC